MRRPLRTTLFPYTTLFRSRRSHRHGQPRGREDPERLDLLPRAGADGRQQDRKSTRLNSSHPSISYAVFCLKKKKNLALVADLTLELQPGLNVITGETGAGK